MLQAKAYWPILKTFYNNKKIPLILPLLIKFVTDIKQKQIFLITFLLNNVLLTNQLFMAQARLRSLGLNEGEILKIIRAVNINKAHGHDGISIRMIKICDESLLKPLLILFKNSLKLSYYPDIWKKSNIIPAHKKDDKQFYLITVVIKRDQFLLYQFLEKYLKK